MLEFCATLTSEPLQILYSNCLDNEGFPQTWKKGNIVPIQKIGDMNSLLFISGKMFEKIIFNLLFEHLDDKNLLNNNQSGFRLGLFFKPALSNNKQYL